MKPPFLAACGALTIAGTMSLAAQTPTQPPATRPQPPAPTQPARTDSSTVTVTGCLKPWDNTMGAMPTDAPARRNRRAMARLMPLVPPVIKAFFPAKRPGLKVSGVELILS